VANILISGHLSRIPLSDKGYCQSLALPYIHGEYHGEELEDPIAQPAHREARARQEGLRRLLR
jgi:hypothetical protein